MRRKRKSAGRKIVAVLAVILIGTLAVIAARTFLLERQDIPENGDSASQTTTLPESKPVDADIQTEPSTDETTLPVNTLTVYATTKVNVRKKPTTESESVAMLSEGDKVERISKESNGWSKVIYKGEIRYIYSEYLTEKKPEVTETQATTLPENTVTVYATTQVNVRKKPTTESESVAMLNEGDKVERISKESNGWSKVIYKGEIRYIYSQYLTEEKPLDITKRNVVDPRGDNWNLVVVNFYNEYDSSYEPKLKKVCADYGYNCYMDERVADWYTKMYKAALKDGIKLVPVSGYRSYATQEKNYKNRIKLWQSRGYSYNESVKRTAEVILPPGTSEHNLGLAMDICSLENSFENSKEYAWLVKNAADYGFILRYTEENRSKTGIVSEPWHWRFVGVEDAKAIKESGLCLEDYVKTKA